MNQCRVIAAILFGFAASIALGGGGEPSAYALYVDSAGNIQVPDRYRTEWVFLGTWAVAAKEGEIGSVGLHNVYTQPDTMAAFKKTGKFPDGAVLVKELLKTETAPMTTGQVSRGVEIEGYFVMIKDTIGRFEGNPLWGDGWGWSFFKANDSKNTVSTDYKKDCISCHLPAKANDWVYTGGYPTLK